MTNEVLILLFISSITNSEQKMMKTSRGLVCPFVDTFFRNDHVKNRLFMYDFYMQGRRLSSLVKLGRVFYDYFIRT